jgi:ubiquinone/menaquinone biosynthesis C-methylase UbiE
VIARGKNWNDYVASAEEIARSESFCHMRDEIIARAGIKAGDRVVDLGAGTGLLTLAAAPLAEHVWAIDISQGMCDYLATKARSAELANVETAVASVTSLPLVDGSVDVAISNYCFHHLSEADKHLALAEAHRVLAPGGRLVFADMMFALSLVDRRNRSVVSSKARALLGKGLPGMWRLLRNLGRWLLGRWEKPAPPEWWAAALRDAGFERVSVEPLRHEGGIAWAVRSQSSRSHEPGDASTPALAGAGH